MVIRNPIKTLLNLVNLTEITHFIHGQTGSLRTSDAHLDILLNIDSSGRLTTTLYDKRDDFDFAVVKFHFLGSDKPHSPAYSVYFSLFIRYTRACFAYENFSKRSKLLTKKVDVVGL
jgi:hypothetical protein